MKILIMSVTAGDGHNSTAKAMASYFKKQNVQVDIVDTFKYISKVLAFCLNKGYLFVTKNTRAAFRWGYGVAEKRNGNSYKKSSARFANQIFIKGVKKCIDSYMPDAIVFTHPFVGIILDLVKEKTKMDIKTFGILTDYTVHPYWEDSLRNDYVVIPNEYLKPQAISKGFREDQIVPLGIPIDQKFAIKRDKKTIRNQLGLDETKKTILLMGGSMGYGDMVGTIKRLDAVDDKVDFQIISVCGNNTKMKSKIDKLGVKRKILNFGFVDYVDQLMDASDVIITKPGGLTVSEALAKNLPMMVVSSIPGHEERNLEFLLNHGAATALNPKGSISDFVCDLLANNDRLQVMKEKISKISKPNSTKDVCDFIMNFTYENN